MHTAATSTCRRPKRTSLESILGEISKETFISEYLGQKTLRLPGDPLRFTHLFSWNAINNILETQMFSAATLRLKKAGNDLPSGRYLTEYSRPNKAGIVTLRASTEAIARELRDGATLIMNEVQTYWPAVRALSEELEETLEARINVNMYASLSESYGFPCHYDVHDVLVLQVDGRKQWQIFPRRTIPPFSDEKFDPSERPPTAAPLWDGLLTQGEALYMPRGVWHFAKPVGESTIHLTIGIVNPTGREFLKWVVQQLCRNDLLVRNNFPQFGPNEVQQRFVTQLNEAITSALLRHDVVAAFTKDRAISDGMAARRHSALPWSALDVTLPPSLDSVIHITTPHGLRTYPSDQSDDLIQLYHRGQPGPQFRSRLQRLCDFLMDSAPVTVGEFVAQHSAHFAESTLTDFLRELARTGLVAVKTPELEDEG